LDNNGGNEMTRIKFCIDKKVKKITFWFPEEDINKITDTIIEKNLKTRDVSERIATVLGLALVEVEKEIGIDLKEYEPVIELVK
jgi:hypothetical protein